MIFIILILTVLCMVNSQPIGKSDINQSDENIFVPYDVKYVPIEVTVEKTVKNQLKHLPENFGSDKKQVDLPLNFLDEAKTKPRGFKDELEISESSEDYVLVPISLLRTLELEAKANKDSLSATHSISKRQAPPGGLVFQPIVQLSRVTRNRRKINRPPALVGYLTDYDQFPTVA